MKYKERSRTKLQDAIRYQSETDIPRIAELISKGDYVPYVDENKTKSILKILPKGIFDTLPALVFLIEHMYATEIKIEAGMWIYLSEDGHLDCVSNNDFIGWWEETEDE